jgi:hypothetical protein
MFTLALSPPGVHSLAASDPVTAPVQPVVVVVVILTIVLLMAALRQLRHAIAPIGELVRLVLSAFGVAVLLVSAMVVLVGGLFLSAQGH